MGRFHIKEVVLVDDDPIVRMVATKILKVIDFSGLISEFENGQLAIDELLRRSNSGTPIVDRSLLLLDINMPGMDAWGFLDRFTQLDKETKKHFFVAIITSSVNTNDRTKAFSYPDVRDYINKPLSGERLTDFLAKHHLLEE